MPHTVRLDTDLSETNRLPCRRT